jgi:hypothetical protein
MSEQFGICSDTVVPGPPPECPALLGHGGGGSLDPNDPQGSPDVCGCNGLTCPADKTCRVSETYCSCQPHRHNVCVEQPCSSDADCGDDVCVPTPLLFGARCFKPKCRSDAECAPGTVCVALVQLPSQAGDPVFAGVECIAPQ